MKRDVAEKPIVEALERIGAQVIRMNLPCDLLVRFRGRIHLLEVTEAMLRAYAKVRPAA